MGVSVLLRLFISSSEVCNIAYALYRIHEQNSNFKDPTMGPMIPKEMKYNLHYGKVFGRLGRGSNPLPLSLPNVPLFRFDMVL